MEKKHFNFIIGFGFLVMSFFTNAKLALAIIASTIIMMMFVSSSIDDDDIDVDEIMRMSDTSINDMMESVSFIFVCASSFVYLITMIYGFMI